MEKKKSRSSNTLSAEDRVKTKDMKKLKNKGMENYIMKSMDEKKVCIDILPRLVQDGGEEGCACTPSCESTGITTNC